MLLALISAYAAAIALTKDGKSVAAKMNSRSVPLSMLRAINVTAVLSLAASAEQDNTSVNMIPIRRRIRKYSAPPVIRFIVSPSQEMQDFPFAFLVNI